MGSYAIVIGISEYKNAERLPACKNDADIVYRILCATNKYSVLNIEEQMGKGEIISTIDNFLLQDNGEQPIDEILFYFSGHGYQDSEAHFALHNTSFDKINSTSLNNSEIDEIVRKYRPKLYVKIIDACQSGLTYIKSITMNENEIDIRPMSSEKTLENCIFMCSSKKNQASLATNKYSVFTQAFVNAIIEMSKFGIIRYKDIQNFITDMFASDSFEQTPYFVLQSDGRDIFSLATSDIKSLVDKIQNSIPLSIAEQGNEVEIVVEKYLQQYRTESFVVELMKRATEELKKISFPSSWINKYYTMKYSDSYYHFEEQDLLKFLYQRRNSENLYVEVDTDETSATSPYIGIRFKPVNPVRFSSMASKLPTFSSLILLPNSEALPRYEISFVFIYSGTYFYIFVSTKQHTCKGWQNYIESDNTKYKYRKINYCDFTDANWEDFIIQQLITSKEFIEKSLEHFVK